MATLRFVYFSSQSSLASHAIHLKVTKVQEKLLHANEQEDMLQVSVTDELPVWTQYSFSLPVRAALLLCYALRSNETCLAMKATNCSNVNT